MGQNNPRHTAKGKATRQKRLARTHRPGTRSKGAMEKRHRRSITALAREGKVHATRKAAGVSTPESQAQETRHTRHGQRARNAL
ncbi:hypothetical protein, conserved in T. vivax [Trypanosoma vivax Y486]|uniref:Uncharacterized protein n=1 Tax=Trypanosoma vivax (strain Y486) TaxID=1055687 RepID=F9WS30_TRYVY|nr:hypothetical protein, conserved in T. vivax [Trypanosoma vivax Y486]|eukprot:CCD20368.1 hypothetical protein, conserved in T. vivax [Trypanosoma vivax Y486]